METQKGLHRKKKSKTKTAAPKKAKRLVILEPNAKTNPSSPQPEPLKLNCLNYQNTLNHHSKTPIFTSKEEMNAAIQKHLHHDDIHPLNFLPKSPSLISISSNLRANSPSSPNSATLRFMNFGDFKDPLWSSRSAYRQKLGHDSKNNFSGKVCEAPISPHHEKIENFISSLDKESTKDLKSQFKQTKTDLEDLIKGLKHITKMDTDEILWKRRIRRLNQRYHNVEKDITIKEIKKITSKWRRQLKTWDI
ncbi:unnamed protein product [Blepharisma stoltei]|uniref:Uncharacterized protein n=1 Tax=Blepharisma stoltei TaxID=1481888 RepID=A0AAU9IMY8_9CILI|nr:unnamed protein product [Blepharisma stoltei]